MYNNENWRFSERTIRVHEEEYIQGKSGVQMACINDLSLVLLAIPNILERYNTAHRKRKMKRHQNVFLNES